MTKRGKILRDTNAGPGLLAVDGRQYSFDLQGTWKSDDAPKVGMVVDVTFDAQDAVASIRAVPENQLAREQAMQSLGKGRLILDQIKAKFGLSTLIAFAVLLLGWFFLSSLEIARETVGIQITFWQLLGFLGSSNAISSLNPYALAHENAGVYGLLAIMSLAGPFVFYFWKDRRAALGGLLPLVSMLIAAALLARGLHQAAHQMGELLGVGDSPAGRTMMNEASAEFMKQFQFGVGAYVSMAASCYFAFVGVKRFLVARA